MRNRLHPLVLLLGGCVTLAAGCAMPGRERSDGAKLPRVAGLPHNPATTAGANALSPTVNRPAPLNASVQPTVAQVGYNQPAECYDASLSDQPACSCCNPSTVCGCGGGGCGACRPPAPYGYAAMPSGPFNAYGIDPQEFICDGGDHPPAATLRCDDSIAGLQPEDTVVHYTNQAGEIEFEASNRVCVMRLDSCPFAKSPVHLPEGKRLVQRRWTSPWARSASTSLCPDWS